MSVDIYINTANIIPLAVVIQGNTFTGYCETTNDGIRVVVIVENIMMLGPLVLQCSAQNPAGNSSLLGTIYITGKYTLDVINANHYQVLL